MPKARKEIESIPDYVPGKSIDEIREKYGLLQVTKLASNENPFGASPAAMAAYKKCAAKLHLYPRGSAPELVKKLALKWKVREENLIIGNGSDEILDLAARVYFNRGDYAAGAGSTFSLYSSAAKIAGANYKAFPLENFCYPLESLEGFKKAGIIFICNPNNPTGTCYSGRVILDFLKKVSKNTLVILDMAYAEFTGEKEPPLHRWIKMFPNLLCTRTFSKLYGLAGLRIGYGISSKEIINTLKKAKPPFNVNYPAQMAALAALDDTRFIEKSLKVNGDERKKLAQNLQGLGFKVLPSGANFVCAKIGRQAREFVVWLESRGMVIRHLGSFAMPEWVRITVGTPEQNGIFLNLACEFKKYHETPSR
ncbi:MAG: histidinol-phosphate transaminase [Candidatus Fibromonas sp.]|jgi:histidinol-phosphate aminotransferase|nr:histidinol-phosphate transaminase [Candidatus Fibromonas sp.]